MVQFSKKKIKSVFVSLIFFEKNLLLYDDVYWFNKNVCYLFWTVSSCICRNIRIISSAQAQFVTALLKLIVAQAQPQKYHHRLLFTSLVNLTQYRQ